MGKKDTFDKHKHSFPSRVVASFYMIEPIKTRKGPLRNKNITLDLALRSCQFVFTSQPFCGLYLGAMKVVDFVW